MKSVHQLTAYLITSRLRIAVLKLLFKEDMLRQTEISDKLNKKQQNIRLVILQLEKLGVVECLTPDKKAWKVYSITDLGKEVCKQLKKRTP